MKHAIGPRRELGQRTIFNLLGPLTNPAGATHQMIGVYDPALTSPLAEVLGELGGRAAFVVHGHGGLDELTTSGPNRVSHLRDGAVKTFDLDAADLGLRPPAAGDLRGGEPAENAAILRALLAGRGRQPAPRRGAAQQRRRAGRASAAISQAAWPRREHSLASGAALRQAGRADGLQSQQCASMSHPGRNPGPQTRRGGRAHARDAAGRGAGCSR